MRREEQLEIFTRKKEFVMKDGAIVRIRSDQRQAARKTWQRPFPTRAAKFDHLQQQNFHILAF